MFILTMWLAQYTVRAENIRKTFPKRTQGMKRFRSHYKEVKQSLFDWLDFDCQKLGLVSFCIIPFSAPFFAEISGAAYCPTDGTEHVAVQLLVQERTTTTGQQEANDILLEASWNGLPSSILFSLLLLV